MPRFKNVHHLGWDVEVWDGHSFVDVPFHGEFDVTDEAAANPTFTDAGNFEPVVDKPAKGAKSGEGDK
jgi:hypothetical protein